MMRRMGLLEIDFGEGEDGMRALAEVFAGAGVSLIVLDWVGAFEGRFENLRMWICM